MDSASEERVKSNVMRHEYRTLTENEKIDMRAIKDVGLKFVEHLDTVASHSAARKYSRELWTARTKVEEAVMWAVKHITG